MTEEVRLGPALLERLVDTDLCCIGGCGGNAGVFLDLL